VQTKERNGVKKEDLQVEEVHLKEKNAMNGGVVVLRTPNIPALTCFIDPL
jgi:hypothetical protein